MDIKKTWKKFWYLLWKDNSFKGWIFSIVFLFIFIKFIFLPGLGFITGTSLPLAIVESCSMYHNYNDNPKYFDEWWQSHEEKYSEFNISKLQFGDFKFKNGLNKGDILFIIKANPEKIKIGDIIIFEANKQNPLIHRVISIKTENGKYIFSTIGDNNNGQLGIEKNIPSDKLIGKMVLKLAPILGWGKLIFFEPLKPKVERGLCKEN